MDFVSSTFDFVPFRIYAIMAVVREHSRFFVHTFVHIQIIFFSLRYFVHTKNTIKFGYFRENLYLCT